MATAKEIAASKARSQAKYQQLRQDQEAAKAQRKADKAKAHEKRMKQRAQAAQGSDWVKTERADLRTIGAKFANFELTLGYIVDREEGGVSYLKTAYTIKAPHDKQDPAFATGLVAYRIMKGTSRYYREFSMPTYLVKVEEGAISDAITSQFKLDLLTCQPHIPQRMARSVFAQQRAAYLELRARKATAAKPANK